MENRDTFSSYHPIINFMYFGLVLVFTMVFTHPVCLVSSLVCAISYSIYLNGRKAVRFNLFFMIPMFVVAALINPAFSHAGLTVLTYLPSGNPLTLESIVYGIATSTMLSSTIVWFSCLNVVITSDKFIYLFGRIIPSTSLLLAMTLRFVPKFNAQLKVVTNVQKCMGHDVLKGTVVQRVKFGLTILSIMITWAMENAIETADSMKSRGYGLPNRTAFSIYQFDKRDATALFYLLLCGVYVIIGAILGGFKWQYYPTMKGVGVDVFPVSACLVYFALCIMPVAIDIMEDIKWNALKYKD